MTAAWWFDRALSVTTLVMTGLWTVAVYILSRRSNTGAWKVDVEKRLDATAAWQVAMDKFIADKTVSLWKLFEESNERQSRYASIVQVNIGNIRELQTRIDVMREQIKTGEEDRRELWRRIDRK